MRKPGKDVGRGRELVIADRGQLTCEDAEELSGVTKHQCRAGDIASAWRFSPLGPVGMSVFFQ